MEVLQTSPLTTWVRRHRQESQALTGELASTNRAMSIVCLVSALFRHPSEVVQDLTWKSRSLASLAPHLVICRHPLTFSTDFSCTHHIEIQLRFAVYGEIVEAFAEHSVLGEDREQKKSAQR